MKKKPLIMLTLCCTVLIVGCAQQNILERISLPTLVGYDYNPEEQEITTTSVIRQVNPEFESNIEIQSATAITSKGTRIDTNLKTSKQLLSGQMRVVLVSDSLAKYGLEGPVHTLAMNSEISTSVYLAVVDGETKPLIEYKYPTIKDLGQYVFNLIDHNVEQQHSISSSLHEVSRDIYSRYKDIALPMIKRQEDSIVLTDLAFFNNGKMVGKLPAKDILYIMMIRDDFENGTVELALPTEAFNIDVPESQDILPIAVDSVTSKKQVDLVNPDTPEFDLKLTVECRLLEIHQSINISKQKDLDALQKEISKKMKSEITRILEYSQELGSDIFGFGEYYHSQTRNRDLSEEEWRNLYKNMKVNVTVETTLLRNGVFE